MGNENIYKFEWFESCDNFKRTIKCPRNKECEPKVKESAKFDINDGFEYWEGEIVKKSKDYVWIYIY